MQAIQSLSPRPALLLMLLASAATVGAALLFQYVGGLAPCELCLMERWPYYIGIPVIVLALAAGGWRAIATGLIVVVLLLFIGSSVLAFYHVGVEQHWFQGPTACTSPATAKTLEELRAQLMAQQPVLCDQVQWSLFGVSLAGWNFLASVVLALLSIAALGGVRGRREA
jgi:disulfide bond formation protein DsbB